MEQWLVQISSAARLAVRNKVFTIADFCADFCKEDRLHLDEWSKRISILC